MGSNESYFPFFVSYKIDDKARPTFVFPVFYIVQKIFRVVKSTAHMSKNIQNICKFLNFMI